MTNRDRGCTAIFIPTPLRQMNSITNLARMFGPLLRYPSTVISANTKYNINKSLPAKRRQVLQWLAKGLAI